MDSNSSRCIAPSERDIYKIWIRYDEGIQHVKAPYILDYKVKMMNSTKKIFYYIFLTLPWLS